LAVVLVIFMGLPKESFRNNWVGHAGAVEHVGLPFASKPVTYDPEPLQLLPRNAVLPDGPCGPVAP
jgi:hypothetical protein